MKADSTLLWSGPAAGQILTELRAIVNAAPSPITDDSWDLAVLVSGVDYAKRARIFCLREWLTYCGGASGRVARWMRGLQRSGWLAPVTEPHDCPAEDWYWTPNLTKAYESWMSVDSELRTSVESFRAQRSIQREYDQAPVTWECSLDRALRLSRLSRRGHGTASICLLGDDDLTSLALAALDREANVTVVDIDGVLLAEVGALAERFDLRISLQHEDLRRQGESGGGFDVVSLDPSPTEPGTRSFVFAAVSRLAPDGYLLMSAYPSHSRPGAYVGRALEDVGHTIVQLRPGAVRYDDSWAARPPWVRKARRELSGGVDFMFTESLLITQSDADRRRSGVDMDSGTGSATEMSSAGPSRGVIWDETIQRSRPFLADWNAIEGVCNESGPHGARRE